MTRWLVPGLLALLAVTSPLGAQSYFGQNQVQYDKLRWASIETEHFLVYYYPEEMRAAKDAARNAGRDPDRLAFFVNPATTVTDDPASVLERKKATVALIHALPGMDRLLLSENWDVPGIMAKVRELMHTNEVLDYGGHFGDMRRLGDMALARAVIPAGLIAEASAIGPIEHVKERIGLYRDAGATHLFFDRRGIPANRYEFHSLIEMLRSA